MNFWKSLCGTGLIAVAAAGILPAQQPEIKPVSLAKNEVRIGLPRSIFRNVPPELVKMSSLPFNRLMMDSTGLNGNVVNDKEYDTVATKLDKGEYQVAVFLGHEYAWAKKKYPHFEIIARAVPLHRNLQAFILVKWDCPAKTIADLKDGTAAIPGGFQDHSMLYFQQLQRKHMGDGQFKGTLRPETIETALDDVIEGKAAFTVADSAAWSYYKGAHPGKSSNLKILCESESFPSACVVCNKNALKPETAAAMKNSMVTAAGNPVAKPILRMIKLSGFEAVTAEYEKELVRIGESYPESCPLDLSRLK